MKTFARLLLVTALCCWGATAALADQRPPVQVRLLGDIEAAVPGEIYKGRLELVTDLDAVLNNFRFEGDDWRQVALDVPSEVFLDKSDRLEIAFELEAGRNGAVEFVFDFDGFTMRQPLDLSQAHLSRMASPAGVTAVAPDGSAAPAPADLPRVDVPAFEADKSDGNDDDEPGVVVNRSIRVHGRFVYQRSDGVTIGADGVWVRVYDEDTFFDDQLASVSTDAYGYYDVTINTDDAGETNPDLYVRFDSSNSKVQVESPTTNNAYAWQTGTTDNYSGSDWNLGWLQPGSEADFPSLHILTDVTRTWRWLINHEGYDTPFIRCNWPNGTSGAFYNGEMYISTGREWNEATHTHEYGHHWIGIYAVQIGPDYCNGICDTSPTDCGHCIWCQETDHDAFSEGWPNWLADVLTRSYAGDYGIAPINTRSQESLNTCGGVLDDPLLTEGFLGALCRDIEDSANDDHSQYPGFADALSLGTNEIFDVVDFDHSTTPMGFLNDFKARFPWAKEGLWETAKNCGYEIDVSAPGVVTNLTSSSHSTVGDSPDPTVRYTWTAAFDDASGIAGYGLFISAGTGMPSAVQDIGDVTSYTTPPLTPGTYYFNIRAVDRAGRWSSSHASFGPVTIRPAEPADLTWRTATGWDYPMVPRGDNTATSGSATVPPTLPGNVSNTYWNVIGKNQGESSTSVGFQSRCYVDDVYRWWASWGVIGAGGNFWGVNLGPFNVKGGRHTFEVRYDATEQVSEIDETNNAWGQQFIWTPLSLTPNVEVTRGTPPDMTGGWDSVSGSTWFNCDGVKASSPGWWNAISIRALDDADDYDVRMHDPSLGAENGFAGSLAFSGRLEGCLDAVIWNRNVTGSTLYEAGVLNWGDDAGNFITLQTPSLGMSFDDSLDIAMAADEYIVLREFYVGTGNIGDVSITVDIDPALGPVYANWLDETFTTGTLLTYNASSMTDATGRARLDFNVADTGYNCLVLYRDPKDGGAALTATVEIQQTPPDFITFEAPGWHSPVVPRPAFDGTPAAVAEPDTLHGNVAETYLNLAVRNESPTGSPSLGGSVHLDGNSWVGLGWGSFPGYANSLFNWNYQLTVRGGRHSMDLRLDPDQNIEEIYETNNTYGEQYVWSPLEVAVGTQVSRGNPPDRTGGWDYLDTSGNWYNCDGLRQPTAYNWWHAMAVMPNSGTDVDLRLHDMLVGTKDGFAGSMAYSGWGLESSDFSLINYNVSAGTGYDAGVLKISGTGGYVAENAGSIYLDTDPVGAYGPFSLGNGQIVDLYECWLNPGGFAVRLVANSGNVDWGISLMPPGLAVQPKSNAMAASWAGLAGENEELPNITITDAGYYCLVVWKAKTSDLSKNGGYSLVFGNGISPVPDDQLPTVSALRGVYPNPFNPMTTIAFDLAHPTRAELAIYDLQGHLVKVLQDGSLPAGSHELVWNGTDARGQRVASGVYMARFRAAAVEQMRKLMLVK